MKYYTVYYCVSFLYIWGGGFKTRSILLLLSSLQPCKLGLVGGFEFGYFASPCNLLITPCTEGVEHYFMFAKNKVLETRDRPEREMGGKYFVGYTSVKGIVGMEEAGEREIPLWLLNLLRASLRPSP